MKIFKKLSVRQFSYLHMGLAVVVVAGVAVIGVKVIGASHADTTEYAELGISTLSTGGVITSSPSGINCGDGNNTCEASFQPQTSVSVTLTVNPDSGRKVLWPSSCSSISGNTCTITVSGFVNISVGYAYTNYDISFHFEGSGRGGVTSSSISCSLSCTGIVPYDSIQTLTAKANSGSVFAGWDYAHGATICNSNYVTMPNTINTSSTCSLKDYAYDDGPAPNLGIAEPIFNLKSPSTTKTPSKTSSPTSTTKSSTTTTPSKTSSPTSTTKSSTNSITLPATTDLTLWNGSNFGQSGQTLTPTSSPTTQVGLADKNNDPVALATVNLSSAQNWTSSNISSGSSSSSYKSYVHGLTSAPGVVGGVFTLFVPYKTNDKYVGICPGASSLTVLGPTCSGLYYLTNGESETNKENTNISTGDTVIASITTINNIKYWSISGLTGTGGFSSPTNTVAVAYAKPQVKPKNSSEVLYIILACVLAVIVILASTYKLWLSKIKKNKPIFEPLPNNTNIVTPPANEERLNNETHIPNDDNNSKTS